MVTLPDWLCLTALLIGSATVAFALLAGSVITHRLMSGKPPVPSLRTPRVKVVEKDKDPKNNAFERPSVRA